MLLLHKTTTKIPHAILIQKKPKKNNNYKLREYDVKYCTCYYFNDILNINDLDSKNMKIDKNHTNIFLSTKLYMKYQMV